LRGGETEAVRQERRLLLFETPLPHRRAGERRRDAAPREGACPAHPRSSRDDPGHDKRGYSPDLASHASLQKSAWTSAAATLSIGIWERRIATISSFGSQ